MRWIGGLLVWMAPWLAAQEKIAPPAIRPHGVVNAASHMPPVLAGGAIARGALFTIFGLRFDAEASLEIRQGDLTIPARVIAANPERIEARMPPGAPLGRVTLAVTSHGQTSAPYALTIVESSFGIFTQNGRGWGPAVTGSPMPVHPGQLVTIEGTGLGSARAAEVYVGGEHAQVRQVVAAADGAAHDRIVFAAPRNSAEGCWTPLLVRTPNGVVSNTATLSVARRGQPCQKPENWILDAVAPGRRGLILLLRAQIGLALQPGEPRTFIDDQAKAFFRELSPRSGPPPQSVLLPPPGACTSYAQAIRLASLQSVVALGGAAFGGRALDAGQNLILRGPAGEKGLDKYYRDGQSYSAHLGGQGLGVKSKRLPLFFTPGDYQISSTGGTGAGRFDVSLHLPPLPLWSNQDDITAVDRTRGVTLRWSQVRGEDQVAVIAAAVDQLSGSLSLCVCQAARGASQFTVPSEALANFPGARNAQAMLPLNLLALMVTSGHGQAFQAQGLDGAVAGWAVVQAKAVDFK